MIVINFSMIVWYSILILNQVFGLLSFKIYPSNKFSKTYHKHKSRLQSGSNNDIQPIGNNKKLPIIQIFNKQEIIGEFFCGDDPDLSILKLRAFLTSLSSTFPSLAFQTYNTQNIYSDAMLTAALNIPDLSYYMLYLYSSTCSKCTIVEPLLDEIYTSYNKYFPLYKIDISYIPTYMSSLRIRLDGISSASLLSTCSVCDSTGFEVCDVCSGRGHILKGTLAVFCPSCVGNKKIRCRQCGGKCLTC